MNERARFGRSWDWGRYWQIQRTELQERERQRILVGRTETAVLRQQRVHRRGTRKQNSRQKPAGLRKIMRH